MLCVSCLLEVVTKSIVNEQANDKKIRCCQTKSAICDVEFEDLKSDHTTRKISKSSYSSGLSSLLVGVFVTLDPQHLHLQNFFVNL